jgi:hypothetical protein
MACHPGVLRLPAGGAPVVLTSGASSQTLGVISIQAATFFTGGVPHEPRTGTGRHT